MGAMIDQKAEPSEGYDGPPPTTPATEVTVSPGDCGHVFLTPNLERRCTFAAGHTNRLGEYRIHSDGVWNWDAVTGESWPVDSIRPSRRSGPVFTLPYVGAEPTYGSGGQPSSMTLSGIFELPDTGRRETALDGQGALRERAPGKGRFDLLSPFVLRRLAEHMEHGALKYTTPDADGARNWEKGQPLGWYLDSLFRHVGQWQTGDTAEDHLAAALWNLHCLIHTAEMIDQGLLPEALDDRPTYRKEHP